MSDPIGYKACFRFWQDAGRCRRPVNHEGPCAPVWFELDSQPVILYRKGVDPDADQDEIEHASKYFTVRERRTEVPPRSLVIGRMSVLPFYSELEKDLKNNGSFLINSYRQHQFIADMREWCAALGDITPRLYERLQDLPEKGPFVVKGQTNSKKHLWNTHMFAEDKRAAGEIYSKLKDDTLFNDQEIYARDYVPLERLATGFNGLPITKEFRFFVAYGQVLCGAFYWASHVADLDKVPLPDCVPEPFLRKAINRIGDHANFYALDVAKTESGEWVVIEINDGQMSGLSCNDPHSLYMNLSDVIASRHG